MHSAALVCRLRSFLGVTAVLLLVTYLSLVAATMFYAALRTELTESARDAEARISTLEAHYFRELSAIQGADPYALGFATLSGKRFVRDDTSAVSRGIR